HFVIIKAGNGQILIRQQNNPCREYSPDYEQQDQLMRREDAPAPGPSGLGDINFPPPPGDHLSCTFPLGNLGGARPSHDPGPPSSCHCQAPRPVAIAKGTVSAAPTRL